MSEQENSSSKRVQGIAASPPLVTRRNKIPNTENTDSQPKTAKGPSVVSTARLARDSRPTTKQQQRAQKPTQEQQRGTAAKSKITKDETAGLTGHPQVETHPHSPTVSEENELLADQDLFSPVHNAKFQTEDERDEDELYTPRRLWNERTTEYHPVTAVRRNTETAELVCNQEWAVPMLAEEREREEETRVAAKNREQRTSRDNEKRSLKQLLEVVQQLQGEIVVMKNCGGRKEKSRADNVTTKSQNGKATPPQRTADRRTICSYCKGEGHIKRYFPKKREDGDRRNNTTVAMISTSDEEDDKDIPLLQIDAGQLLTEEVKFGKNDTTKKTEAVIDTGAAVSIISPKLTAEMALELKTWGGPQLEMIEYGTGKPKMRFGELTVRIAIEDQTTTPATKTVAKSGARIPARSMAAVEIEQTEATKPTLDGLPWMIEIATNRTTGPKQGRALMPGDRPTVWVMMTNLEIRSVYIHKKMVLGHRAEVVGIGTEIDSTGRANRLRTLNTELEKGTTNILDFTPSINQELPAEERKGFEDTLRDNTACFAREGEQLRRCNVAEHEIQLTPNAQRSERNKVHRELTLDILKKGVIEEATGPWSARTLLIQKKDVSWRFCLDFHPLNSVTIFSRDTKQHIRRLKLVLAALRKANLKLKLTKFRFGESAIIALGHKINADGISPDPGEVRAVQNFPTPPATASRAEKVKFIKSFFGLCSSYRRHIPGFAEAAKLLFDLTRDKSLFIWTQTHQERIDKLKQMLADAAALAYPDPMAEFRTHPDDCGYGIEAVLLQKTGWCGETPGIRQTYEVTQLAKLLHNRKRMPGSHLGDKKIPTVHLRMPNKNHDRPPCTMLAPIKN
ncbi:Uncharacterized protein APZ42_025090 [Daphnia magna]|uniref:Reverse transcriptase/retrotransposon-derived protein RNase H-like domain-containing protein n=1 Tax=Daphnia magna TaxID=35525 RepID=A0A164TGI2_9CRUS|nr:Uncharacterized protein APZ42_025090 [Daphnia magna]